MFFDIDYSEEKNELLRKTRHVCFEDIMNALLLEGYVDYLEHPNRKKYSHQKILVVRLNNYIYKVPYVINRKKRMIFLKTLYPDRKLTKKYIK